MKNTAVKLKHTAIDISLLSSMRDIKNNGQLRTVYFSLISDDLRFAKVRIHSAHSLSRVLSVRSSTGTVNFTFSPFRKEQTHIV